MDEVVKIGLWLDSLEKDERKLSYFVETYNLLKSRELSKFDNWVVITKQPSRIRSVADALMNSNEPAIIFAKKNPGSVFQNKEDVIREINFIRQSLSKTSKPTHLKLIRKVKNLYNYYQQLFLTDDDLAWIDKTNDLMVYWLWLYITYIAETHAIRDFYMTQFDTLTIRDSNDAYFQMLQILDRNQILSTPLNYNYKVEFSNRIRASWSDFITGKSKYNWLDESNEEQCFWAWNYLTSRGLTAAKLVPMNHTQAYIFTLITLDIRDIAIENEERYLKERHPFTPKKLKNQKSLLKKNNLVKPFKKHGVKESLGQNALIQ
jgi:hypothetical protein